MIGKVVFYYKILEKLGEGGTGLVYLCNVYESSTRNFLRC
jgi:hypothetical protein